MSVFGLFFFSLAALAQNSTQFSLQGTYSVSSQSLSPTPINFSISWNETGNKIEGTYSDNYFSQSSPVTGSTETFGRTFNIVFPTPTQGIRSILMTTAQTGIINTTIPLTIQTRNPAGVPVDNSSVNVSMTSQPYSPAASSTNACVLGFGTLTGYCGLYAGTISENHDPANRCNLLGPGSTRLELAIDTRLALFFNYQTTTSGVPVHRLGAIPPSPLNNNLNVSARNCGTLAQTNFSSANCQTMILTGAFLDLGGTRNFTGTYTITDETNKETCTYSMNLNRDIVY